ncbi:hypothetical protein C8J57DRAFT_1707219 [Mycena rebaudengoi]|nr:hypothetical protein C8J57DRAFT_1707219 [Mycena rebaudengoi]
MTPSIFERLQLPCGSFSQLRPVFRTVGSNCKLRFLSTVSEPKPGPIPPTIYQIRKAFVDQAVSPKPLQLAHHGLNPQRRGRAPSWASSSSSSSRRAATVCPRRYTPSAGYAPAASLNGENSGRVPLTYSFSPIASPSTPSPLLLPRLRTLSYPSAPSCLSCRPPLFSLLTLPPIPPPVAPSCSFYLLRPIFPRLPLAFRSLRTLRTLRRAMTMNMASLASCVVYLGNIHPEPSTELDPRGRAAARAVHVRHLHRPSHVPHLPGVGRPRLTLNNRRLKLGWGKDSRSHTSARCATSTPAPSRTSRGKSSGPPTCTLAMLAGAPSAPSPIALVRFLKETYAFPPPRLVIYQGGSHMNCAFVDFTNVSDVTKAENRSKYAAHRAREGPVCGCTQGLGRWGRTASGNGA